MDTSRNRKNLTRRLITPPLAILALLAGIASGGSPLSSARSPLLPIKASISAVSVRPGDTLTIEVHTDPGAHILLHVTYSGGGGFKKRGTADTSGLWTHSWQVSAHGPGPGSAQLFVQSGSQSRYYTLTFIVLPPAPVTPTATVVSTPSVTPTPTATPGVPASFFIRGLRIELPGQELYFDPKVAPLREVQVGQKLRLSLYSFVTFSPANPGWHSRFVVYRNGKEVAHRDLHPSLKKSVQDHYYVDVWTYTPTQPGSYKVTASLTLTNVTRRASASVTVTPPYSPQLHVSATSLHVGQTVAIWVTSAYWPAAARVIVSLSSPDHTWKGGAAWKASCSCLGVRVPLEKKIHGPENVRVVAQVVSAGKTTWLTGQLTVRGLNPPVTADVNPDPINYGDTATITGTSLPGAACAARVDYSTGQSATDLSTRPQTVGKSGIVTWTWRMLSKGTSGAAYVSCTYRGAKATGSTVFSIA